MAASNLDGRVRDAVWIVDDSPTEAEMARRALADDFEVHVLYEGSALLELVVSGPPPPDVLVLDWIMPGLSGIEVLDFLRQRPQTAPLPVLMLTAQGGTSQIVEGLSAGANDFLSKPYAPAELRARIAALLRGSALRARADRAESLLQQVLAQLPDAVFNIDAEGKLLFVNFEATRVLGAPADKVIGKPLTQLVPELNPASFKPGAEGRPLADVRIGERMFAPRLSVPATPAEGASTLVLRDVTEQRRAESRRLDFYSMVAHDMRSPLAAILMRAQLLLRGTRGKLAPEVAAEIAKVGDRTRDLVSLINDFMTVSQLESVGFRLERNRLDVAELIAEAADEYQPLADARNITLALDAPRGLCFVEGDERRLLQVLANLISNSLKYSPSGGRTTIMLSAQDGQVVITVADQGAGIPASALPGLFQKWTRLAGAAKVEGTGLGLVIVREIVEAHGGTVGVTSAPGQGSSFWFKLPAIG